MKNILQLRNFFMLVIVVLLSSCERDITVDLPQPEQQIVVEGYITPGMPAYVLISKTAAFFAPVDSATLSGYAVKGATVTLSNGIYTDTLVELSPSIGYVYISPNMLGEIGRTYFLKIQTTDGKTLTSITQILNPVPLDSVWFKVQPDKDTLGYVWARLSDPSSTPNSYRWFAKRLGKDEDFIAPIGSIFDDKFFNGKSFDFAYNRGEVPNSQAADDDNEEEGFFKTGDTIAIKFASITAESYDFWRTAENQASSNGNPFASSAPLKSNITGGIGIWEGFSFTLDTIVAQ